MYHARRLLAQQMSPILDHDLPNTPERRRGLRALLERNPWLGPALTGFFGGAVLVAAPLGPMVYTDWKASQGELEVVASVAREQENAVRIDLQLMNGTARTVLVSEAAVGWDCEPDSASIALAESRPLPRPLPPRWQVAVSRTSERLASASRTVRTSATLADIDPVVGPIRPTAAYDSTDQIPSHAARSSKAARRRPSVRGGAVRVRPEQDDLASGPITPGVPGVSRLYGGSALARFYLIAQSIESGDPDRFTIDVPLPPDDCSDGLVDVHLETTSGPIETVMTILSPGSASEE